MQIKEGLRKRKVALTESVNSDWEDLAADWGLEFRISNPRELHLYVMLNEVKHLVLGIGECFLPGMRFFVAALPKNDINWEHFILTVAKLLTL
jgi:hypothetical protein